MPFINAASGKDNFNLFVSFFYVSLPVKNANFLLMRNMPNYIFLMIVILLLGIIILLCYWLFAVQKNAKRRFVLLKAEIDETDLKLKAKEKQSDHLINHIKTLNSHVKEYKQKIDEYEHHIEKQQERIKDGNLLYQMIIDDIAKLINKKLSGKDEYVEALQRIDGKFIFTLKRVYSGNLSVPYLKYCVCFAIGMTIEEVSECFSIEQSSVHMVRYRLKKKFGLNNREDLNIFLRKV